MSGTAERFDGWIISVDAVQGNVSAIPKDGGSRCLVSAGGVTAGPRQVPRSVVRRMLELLDRRRSNSGAR